MNNSDGVNRRAEIGQKTDIFSHQGENFSGSQNRKDIAMITIKVLRLPVLPIFGTEIA
jgi:hypothetical protein